MRNMMMVPSSPPHAADNEKNHDNQQQDNCNSWKQQLEGHWPRRHIDELTQHFNMVTSRIVHVQPSPASGGTKLVIQLASGNRVETVLIRHAHHFTVCVSSQCGCRKACSFCQTGTMGLLQNLSSAEILEQVWLAQAWLASDESREDELNDSMLVVRNVVFMGMGEPLDNYDAVHEACRGLTHQCLFGFKSKHVTISTVGDAPDRIRQLAHEVPQISLALSLHGATQELRQELVPTARRAPLMELEAALSYHAQQPASRGILLEYLLIQDVNDTDEAARALVEFCQRARFRYLVNLIPYNPTAAGDARGYQTPSDERVETFQTALQDHQIPCMVRWSSARGRDSNGACGQLAASILSG